MTSRQLFLYTDCPQACLGAHIAATTAPFLPGSYPDLLSLQECRSSSDLMQSKVGKPIGSLLGQLPKF